MLNTAACIHCFFPPFAVQLWYPSHQLTLSNIIYQNSVGLCVNRWIGMAQFSRVRWRMKTITYIFIHITHTAKPKPLCVCVIYRFGACFKVDAEPELQTKWASQNTIRQKHLTFNNKYRWMVVPFFCRVAFHLISAALNPVYPTCLLFFYSVQPGTQHQEIFRVLRASAAILSLLITICISFMRNRNKIVCVERKKKKCSQSISQTSSMLC